MGPSINENSYYPYLLDRLDPPISVLTVVALEVVVSNHNVISPVAMGAAGSREPIWSVGNNGHVWPPFPLMSLQSKIFDIVGEL
jgi:hypothetical protein